MTEAHISEIPRIAALPEAGLTNEQAARLFDAGLSNAPVDAPTKTVGQIIIANVCTYFNLVFAILAVVILLVGAWRELLFLPVVILNSAIGIIQELRAKKTLDKLTLMSEPRAKVVRDGTLISLRCAELVRDDIVEFTAGNQICADAEVVTGEVQVNESLITGEPDEILKAPGTSLLSGSYIVAGTCRARLDKVGAASFVSKLTIEAKAQAQSKSKSGSSEMMRSLTRLVQVIGILIIPVGALLFWHQYYVLGEEFRQCVITTIAALVGMIPEGLYLLTSIALAVGVIRLASMRTLTHDLGCIETLARVNVLCVDKTGTITEPEMLVEDLILLEPTRFSTEDAEQLLADHCLNLGAENDTMKAIKRKYGGKPARPAVRTLPFNSKNKFSIAEYDTGECYLLGAPEFILDEPTLAEYRAEIEPQTASGLRVLLLAMTDSEDETGDAVPICLVTLSNKVRAGAVDTFRYFAEQGVTIKVISGDNDHTVSYIAGKAGIANAEASIDATTLTTDSEIAAAASEYTVFGRVTPEQKRKLIKALKAAGNTVAMTGDGVNDILALKEADCSVAMASGSDVAAQVSQLVLLDSDFSAMPGIVAEGRRVINNIQRGAALFLVKNIFSFVCAVLSIIAGFAYPVTPAQLSLVSMLTIGLPSFVLALEPNTARVTGHFLRGVLYRALPGGLTAVAVAFGVMFFGIAGEGAAFIRDDGTVSAILLALVGFLVLYKVCTPFTALRRALCGTVAALLVLCATVFGRIFSLSTLGYREVLIIAVIGLAAVPIMNALTQIEDKLAHWIELLRTANQLEKGK
ncbi:MAG: HAD-IC family P-type ATPase [Oscillospiraceae bacterium]|jgi:cation-transporting ATPase E|nr:HAD-IC family P-type ATPase [Oscillospiraceae bacterium]